MSSLLPQLMRELWSARTSMKHDAQSIVKTHYNVNELIQPETQKANVEALIGTSDRLLATYLCGILVSTHPLPSRDRLSDHS